MQEKQQSNSGLIAAGYIISIMPLLMLPIVFTPGGVFIGILNISKNETVHGFIQIIISIIAGLYGTHLGGAGFGLPRI
jgi:hypothetical protein